ncbi:MAG: zinc-ribbon domain-containing protein [Pseudomonadales bacterium]|nr:zinc-ribbon domain-containing protein [Pseudomonadales bacterium]
MSTSITQCPNCSTSFKVTDAQLSAAGGSVRCGACLQIFKGSDYIFDNDETSMPEDSIGELAEEHEVGRDDDTVEDETKALEEPAEGSLEEQDEDFFEGQVEEHEAAREEDSVEEEAKEIEEEPAEGSLKEPAEGSLEEQAEGSLEEQAEGSLDEQAEGSAEEQIETEVDEETLLGMSGNINVIDDEPVDIVGEYIPSVSTRIMPWAGGIFILLLVFILQFAWFNKNVLSQHPALRNYFQYTCNTFGCKVPEYSNFELLSVSGLLIRTHPEQGHALKIDAILRNDGVFRQRFPKLQLRFTNINDRTIASRSFLPREYLRGEVTGLKFIPASTEVRLALEIVDPDAIGYSLMILPE